MGFECGFCSVTKAHDCTVEQAVEINNLLNNNDVVPPELESQYNYYKFHLEGEYGELPYNINYWCSAGKEYLDDFITSHLEEIDENSYKGITHEFIEQGISWASQELCKVQLVPVQILKAYTDENNKVGTLVNCKGIEVLDERGNRKFINSEKDYIFIAEGEYDEDRQYVLENFIETLKLISKMDLEKNLIWYYRSW